MPRVPFLLCSDCRRRFGGDETLKRHRVLAGDRYRCLSDQELRGRNYYFRDGAWHRGRSLLHATTATLFDAEPEVVPTPARRLHRATDPETSRLSAEAAAPKTGTLKAGLLAAYRAEPGGLTTHEAAARTGIPHQSVTKRTSDLENEGFITKAGTRMGPFKVNVHVFREAVDV